MIGIKTWMYPLPNNYSCMHIQYICGTSQVLVSFFVYSVFQEKILLFLAQS